MGDTMSNYSAIVARIKVRPHPNADRLLLGTVLGNQVVVGLDTEDDELGVFFPTDGQLSHAFCDINNLYTKAARERLGLAPSENVGFFDHKRRVRAQRFRGEKSDGIWLPMRYLSFAGWTGDLKEGDTFTEFGGHEICQKYYTPATLRALKGGTPRTRREVKTFPKHDDTKQFRFVADDVPECSILYLTEKLHGTSGRYGHVYEELPQPWWRRLLGLRQQSGWRYLNGSKNVILERADERNSFYGTDEFRYNVVRDITLHKGEVLYFEIVGWVNETAPIMPPHDVTKTGLKDIQAQYGDTIHYTYGCPRGTHRMYVYKITQVNQDGHAVELSWPQLTARCAELGLAHVPLLGGPYVHDGSTDSLRALVEQHTTGSSTLDPTQIREGVVLRVESRQGTAHIKNKQWAFGVLEGFWKEAEESVDLEDVS